MELKLRTTQRTATQAASNVISLDIAARVGLICGPLENIKIIGIYEELAVVRVKPYESPDPFIAIPLVDFAHTEAWKSLRTFYYALLNLLNARNRLHYHKEILEHLEEVLTNFRDLLSPASLHLLKLWLHAALLGEPTQLR